MCPINFQYPTYKKRTYRYNGCPKSIWTSIICPIRMSTQAHVLICLNLFALSTLTLAYLILEKCKM
jgi:hypothetical protein